MELIQIRPLPQLVPSRVCLSCGVCCRFPEADCFLRPYFTAEEIGRAVAAGVEAAHFSDRNGCQVSLVPNSHGEGYHCPAFDPATSHCRIYEVRPLDCQIYPFAVMKNADQSRVVLGWDTKCPFMRDQAETEHGPADIQAYADRIAALVEGDDSLERFATNPPLIGRFQEDVVILRPLPRLTERINREALGVSGKVRPLTPLTLADRALIDRA